MLCFGRSFLVSPSLLHRTLWLSSADLPGGDSALWMLVSEISVVSVSKETKHEKSPKCGWNSEHFSQHNLTCFMQISEGISFPNLLERSMLRLPLSKLCTVPRARSTEQSTFGGGEKGEKVRDKGRKRGGQQRGQKVEKWSVKTSR